jgi:hypothetical protein
MEMAYVSPCRFSCAKYYLGVFCSRPIPSALGRLIALSPSAGSGRRGLCCVLSLLSPFLDHRSLPDLHHSTMDHDSARRAYRNALVPHRTVRCCVSVFDQHDGLGRGPLAL